MHVAQLLTRAAQLYPDRPAWLLDEPVSYRQADKRVNRFANALVGLGLKPGDRVATLLWNGPVAIEVLFGILRAGLVVVPINPRLRPPEVSTIIADSEAAAIVHSHDLAETWLAVRDELPSVRASVQVGGEGSSGSDYESILGAASDRPRVASPRPEDLAWIFYTSGTTGVPKGAMLTHRSLLTLVAVNQMDVAPAAASDVLLHVLPLSHAGGFFMLHYVARGSAHVFPPTRRFDPAAFFDTVARYGVTAVGMAPVMIHMLAAAPERTRYVRGALNTIVYGGAALAAGPAQEAMSVFGPIFGQTYGLGEAPLSICSLGREHHFGERLSSAGRPTTGTLVRLQDDDWQPVSDGVVGEVAVRGDLVMSGYLKRPDATQDAMRDGWFRTGDLGRFDDEGFLYLTDRKKDIIKTGSATVSPREVERILLSHPGVQDAAVIGVPDETWGELVKAIIVPQEGAPPPESELLQLCDSHLASYKKPRSIVFVSELPRDPTGKVLRRELRNRHGGEPNRKV